MRPYDRGEFYVERVRSDARWRDLERSGPVESGLEWATGWLIILVSVFGVLWTASRFI